MPTNHCHRGRSVEIRLARGRTSKGAIPKFGVEQNEHSAIGGFRLLPETLMNSREVLARGMPVSCPEDRGGRTRVVNDMINGVQETQTGQFTRHRLEPLGD